jgi:type VI secretion system protein ImpJ
VSEESPSTGPTCDPLQWHEGMMLLPQHFQQAWLRGDAVLSRHLNRVNPFHYGVTRLTVDPGALTMGVVRVTQLGAVMPDGLLVSWQPTDPGSLQLVLTDDVEIYGALERGEPVVVCLAVPEWRPGSAGSQDESGRWRSVDGPAVVDENTGESPESLPRLRPRMRLAATQRLRPNEVSLPLLRLTYKDESVQRTDYEPPRISLPPDSPLGAACRDTVRRLREKAAYLVERQRTAGAGQDEAREAIQCLVGGLPLMEALLNVPQSHPFDIFLALCGVAGEISPISPSMVPPLFPAYDHRDISTSLDAVLNYIDHTLDQVSQSYLAVVFAAMPGGFRLRLEAGWGSAAIYVGVRPRQSQSETEAAGWMNEALIAGEDEITLLQARRVRGARRQLIDPGSVPDIAVARGILLFRIDNEDGALVDNQVLAIVNTLDRAGTRRPGELILYRSSARNG